MKKYVCEICGYVYDPAVGDEDHGIAPGTPFESLPENWLCPPCSAGKEHFAPLVEPENNDKDLYICEVCGYVYDPAVGDPQHGVEKGTPFAKVPDSWLCPPCGANKDHFKKYQM